ncbi:MAG: hypothetical protein KAY24_15660, partial [Candidatus Eisenbacteria sp.]|nr:hypothetical protein [Candidatus Eisenbacteria bacterium]
SSQKSRTRILYFADIGIVEAGLSQRIATASRDDPLIMRNAARDVTQKIEVRLPAGMSVLNLPPDLKLSGAGVSYERSARIDGNKLLWKRQFILKPDRVQPQDYPMLKELIDKALLDARRGIVLVRQ